MALLRKTGQFGSRRVSSDSLPFREGTWIGTSILRVPSQLHREFSQAASERYLSLNQLAVQALETYLVQEKRRFPLKESSDMLAPAAQAKGLTEEELMRHVREVRRRIWQV